MKSLSLADRLGLVNYRNQEQQETTPHIQVDTSICNNQCSHHCTIYVCPAQCYKYNNKGEVIFQVEDCIECGTCLYACDQKAVRWDYPDPEKGKGVDWLFG